MRCPFCNADKEMLHVIDSRTCEGGRAIRRRRVCKTCKKRFTTYERIEQPNRLMVVKKDGRRVPWDRGKIITGLERACFKRPVPETEILRVAEEVEEEIYGNHDREVPSTVVGELVTDKLRRIDQVAYVRFASVYRQFKTLEELVNEARAVIDAQHYDVPGQGRLFIDPPGVTQRTHGNGHGAEGAKEDDKPRSRRGRKPKTRETPPEDVEKVLE
jgi:transcriptional repressor NrdR